MRLKNTHWMRLALPTFLALILFLISTTNYLLFHLLAELFAVFIAFLCGMVAWNTYSFSRNSYILFIGIGYIWVGILDLIHAAAFPGMNLLDMGSTNTSAQIWLVSRYLEATILLTSSFFLKRHFNQYYAIFLIGFICSVSLLSIRFGFFPNAFIEGEGLTSFKIYHCCPVNF